MVGWTTVGVAMFFVAQGIEEIKRPGVEARGVRRTRDVAASSPPSTRRTALPAPPSEVPPSPELIRLPPRSFEERYAAATRRSEGLSLEAFLAKYPPPRHGELTYDPLRAQRLPEVVDALAASPEQLHALSQAGLVVLEGGPGVTFEQAYSKIYDADLPVVVTTDSILYALHRSFDSILKTFELEVLRYDVEDMLASMRQNLVADLSSLPSEWSEAAADVDVFLAVAESLLLGVDAAPVGGGDPADVSAILHHVAGLSPAVLTLFGKTAPYDYSQMKPRGHYERNPVLQRYFRAVMWLGRTEVVLSKEGQLNRQGMQAAFLMSQLLRGRGRDAWDRVNRVIESLIGERDNMDVRDMDQFRSDAHLGASTDLLSRTDHELLTELAAGDYGLQRIQSQILFQVSPGQKIVLPRVFLLLGQRFIVDSYVFHRHVFDRVEPERYLPSPLEVPFALGSNTAAALLGDELLEFAIQGAFDLTRFVVSEYPSDYWDSSFYAAWLKAIGDLGRSDAPRREDRPQSMRTRTWEHKMLNAQLASWAELRHDTLLYAKQSYGGGPTCEYPDVYLEPYPEVYARLGRVAGLGRGVAEDLLLEGFDVARVRDFFENFEITMAMLEAIAEKELDQVPLYAEEFHFLRQTAEIEAQGCGPVHWDGWYPQLFFDRADLGDYAPTVADVHTSPATSEVLHAATGGAHLMILTVDDCEGSRAFVGPVSSYYEVVEEGYHRLSDSEWLNRLAHEGPPPRPWWLHDFVVP